MDILNIEGILGKSPKMQACISKLRDAAEHTKPVLISGEVGTGKKLFSKKIHEMSRLHDGPFRLFDAFTQPRNPFIDIFESNISSVDGGTLVFHDIDTLPKCFQESLASHFSNQQFDSHFGKTEVPFRMITTTTESLQNKISEGTFSKCLYDYISDFHIFLPPLRERSTDIEAIVSFYLKKICSDKFAFLKEYTPEFILALEEYEWPHNVKELIEVLQISVRNSGDEKKLDTKHLPLFVYRPEKQPIVFSEDLLLGLENSDTSRIDENKLHKYSKEENVENSFKKPEDTKPMLCFYEDDDCWYIGKLGDERRFKDLKGMRVIHQLLLRPNEWIGCGLLSRVADKSGIITNDETEKMWEYGSLDMRNDIDRRIDACVLDKTSKRRIKAALKVLESEIEEMELSGKNPEELADKKDKSKFLKRYLKGGKQPDSSSQDEKARSAIQKNIKLARDNIVQKIQYMKWHLARITTKYHCIYESEGENEPQWILQKDVRDRRIKET